MKAKTLKRFKNMVKPYKKTIFFVTITALIIDVCELIKPILVKEVMEKYLPNKVFVQNGISIGMIFLAYLFIVIAGNSIDYLNRIITSRMGENVVYTLRKKLYNYIEKSNVSFHDKTPSGKLFVRVINDTEDVYSLFDEVVTTLPKDIMIVIGLFSIMIYISAKLSIINLLIIPLLLTITLALTKAMNKIFSKSKEARTKLNTFLAESIYDIKLIKIFNRQKEKQIECERNTQEHINSVKGLGILFGILPAVMELVQNIGTMLIVLFCANKWLGVDLNPGVVFLFITYLNKIFEPINRIVENVEIVEDAMSSVDKIYEILEHDEYLEDMNVGKNIENVKR